MYFALNFLFLLVRRLRVIAFMVFCLYVSKITYILLHGPEKCLKIDLQKMLARSPNVFAVVGLPIACTRAIPSITMLVLVNTDGNSGCMNESVRICDSAALSVGRRFPLKEVSQGHEHLVVHSRDTDVLLLLIHHVIAEVWMVAGTKQKPKYIPVHQIESH